MDSECISSGSSPDDVTSLIGAIGCNTFKMSFLLFLIFILITSDVFIEGVLSSKDNSYAEGRGVTVKGAVSQGLILSLCYIILNILINCEYI
jgi:hypothetical protein